MALSDWLFGASAPKAKDTKKTPKVIGASSSNPFIGLGLSALTQGQKNKVAADKATAARKALQGQSPYKGGKKPAFEGFLRPQDRKPVQEVQAPLFQVLGPAKPLQPGYGAYAPDQSYANAVGDARRNIAAELAGLDATRKARIAEIQSRYNLDPNGTEQEKKVLGDFISGINADTKKAADAIANNYGAALNETKARAADVAGLVAQTAGNVRGFYDAAAANVEATNATALQAASAGTSNLGLGSTVIGGAAALAPGAIQVEGLRAGAEAENSAQNTAEGLSFLQNVLTAEQGYQGTEVQYRGQENAARGRTQWQADLAARLRADQAALNSSVDQVNGTYDARGFQLNDSSRDLGVGLGQYQSEAANEYQAGKREYDTALNLSRYENEQANYEKAVLAQNKAQASPMTNALQSALTEISQQNVGTQGAVDVTGNNLYADATVNNPVASLAALGFLNSTRASSADVDAKNAAVATWMQQLQTNPAQADALLQTLRSRGLDLNYETLSAYVNS